MPEVLAREAVETELRELAGWSIADDGDSIEQSFLFRDFSAAFGFMSRVALAAEQADHHPNWSNSWNKVRISLTTHSAGGITGRDLAFARKIDGIAASLALPPSGD